MRRMQERKLNLEKMLVSDYDLQLLLRSTPNLVALVERRLPGGLVDGYWIWRRPLPIAVHSAIYAG